MLSRKNRFRGHNSVSRVRGSRESTPYFRVFYARNHKRRDFRMAVVVSKKTAKSAVVRNRIRRRLYEAVRVSQLLDDVSADVVFVVSTADLAKISAAELKIYIERVCSQIAVKTS